MHISKNDTEMHVLYLPKWYPDKTDAQLGTFNRQLIRQIKKHGPLKASVVYLRPVRKKKEAGEEHREENGVSVHIIYYKSCRLPLIGKWANAIRYRKKAIEIIDTIHKKRKLSLTHAMGLGRNSWIALWLKKNTRYPT
jgi:hypothetical protein